MAAITVELFPNPFAVAVTLRVAVREVEAQELVIRIYTLDGRLIRELTLGTHGAGTYTITWDGRSNDGTLVAPGAYVYFVTSGSRRLGEGKIQIVR
jgi:flagellar hook assembly protein FlgD